MKLGKYFVVTKQGWKIGENSIFVTVVLVNNLSACMRKFLEMSHPFLNQRSRPNYCGPSSGIFL
jgi:hypothetical protein